MIFMKLMNRWYLWCLWYSWTGGTIIISIIILLFIMTFMTFMMIQYKGRGWKCGRPKQEISSALCRRERADENCSGMRWVWHFDDGYATCLLAIYNMQYATCLQCRPFWRAGKRTSRGRTEMVKRWAHNQHNGPDGHGGHGGHVGCGHGHDHMFVMIVMHSRTYQFVFSICETFHHHNLPFHLLHWSSPVTTSWENLLNLTIWNTWISTAYKYCRLDISRQVKGWQDQDKSC